MTHPMFKVFLILVIGYVLSTIADPKAPDQAKHDAVLGPELLAAIERHPDGVLHRAHGTHGHSPPAARPPCRSWRTA